MSEYVISAVGSDGNNAPRHYDSKYGSMIAYKLKLEGVNDIVEISKKSDSPAPQKGDKLTGTIEKTDYGHKFKADKPAFGSKPFQPKDEAGIKAMWAIGQAVQVECADNAKTGGVSMNRIEANAKELFAMVDRVKTGESKPVVKDVAVEEISDDPIDLSDIPF